MEGNSVSDYSEAHEEWHSKGPRVGWGIVHRCPPWCHECPDINAIVKRRGDKLTELDIMPWCMGGSMAGMDGCHCDHSDPHLDNDTIARAQWFNDERLRQALADARVRREDEVAALRRKRKARTA